MPDRFQPGNPQDAQSHLEAPYFAPERGHPSDLKDAPRENPDQPPDRYYRAGLYRIGNTSSDQLVSLISLLLRSWVRWWRAEPWGAALYTLVFVAGAGLWLTWSSPAAQEVAAGSGLGVRVAIAVMGVLLVGGIPGGFLARWRVGR